MLLEYGAVLYYLSVTFYAACVIYLFFALVLGNFNRGCVLIKCWCVITHSLYMFVVSFVVMPLFMYMSYITVYVCRAYSFIIYMRLYSWRLVEFL